MILLLERSFISSARTWEVNINYSSRYSIYGNRRSADSGLDAAIVNVSCF
jgi:hypothetical protein